MFAMSAKKRDRRRSEQPLLASNHGEGSIVCAGHSSSSRQMFYRGRFPSKSSQSPLITIAKSHSYIQHHPNPHSNSAAHNPADRTTLDHSTDDDEDGEEKGGENERSRLMGPAQNPSCVVKTPTTETAGGTSMRNPAGRNPTSYQNDEYNDYSESGAQLVGEVVQGIGNDGGPSSPTGVYHHSGAPYNQVRSQAAPQDHSSISQQSQICFQQQMQLQQHYQAVQGAPTRRHGRMGRRFTLNPLIFAKDARELRRQSLAQLKLSYYPKNATPDVYDGSLGFCSWVLLGLSWLFLLATFPISVCFCIKIVQEYERAVVFRLGRLIGGGAKGPGIFFVMPCVEKYVKVDLRTVSFSVPPQEILTRDSVTVSVDAVVYYRISNATVSVANVENAHHSTRLLAQTTLRNMLGTRNLSEILSDRDNIASSMQTLLDEATESWGIKVERVEVKDVRLPIQLQRAMAAEAEATREARAKVIAAEGEQKASHSLHDAANVIATSPAALQLRYLQTLNSVAAEKNSTIIFPFPVELARHFISSLRN